MEMDSNNMKTTRDKGFLERAIPIVALLIAIGLSSSADGAETDASKAKPSASGLSLGLIGGDNLSLQNEVQHAIDQGLAWLTTNQNTNDWWQTSDHPAVTGLALMAFNGDPMDRYRGNCQHDLALKLMQQQQPDGSWVNDNARWWEKEPALVTSYALLSLEMLWRDLGGE